ncbi:hypothetical protein OKW47_007850 [Paraburkholderia atlantica]
MSDLHPRPYSNLFEHLNRTTASVLDVLRSLRERAGRLLDAQVTAMRTTIRLWISHIRRR